MWLLRTIFIVTLGFLATACGASPTSPATTTPSPTYTPIASPTPAASPTVPTTTAFPTPGIPESPIPTVTPTRVFATTSTPTQTATAIAKPTQSPAPSPTLVPPTPTHTPTAPATPTTTPIPTSTPTSIPPTSTPALVPTPTNMTPTSTPTVLITRQPLPPWCPSPLRSWLPLPLLRLPPPHQPSHLNLPQPRPHFHRSPLLKTISKWDDASAGRDTGRAIGASAATLSSPPASSSPDHPEAASSTWYSGRPAARPDALLTFPARLPCVSSSGQRPNYSSRATKRKPRSAPRNAETTPTGLSSRPG